MPKYRCVKPFLFQPPKDANGIAPGPILHAIGDVVEYDGLPSANLEPLDAKGEAMRDRAEAHFAKQAREAKIKQAPAGQEILAALSEALLQVSAKGRRVKLDDEPAMPVPIAGAGEDDNPKALRLTKATSSEGRSHAAE